MVSSDAEDGRTTSAYDEDLMHKVKENAPFTFLVSGSSSSRLLLNSLSADLSRSFVGPVLCLCLSLRFCYC